MLPSRPACGLPPPCSSLRPNQLIGYEHYAKGADNLVGRSLDTNDALVRAFQDNKITDSRVGRVEVYRWNTEIFPRSRFVPGRGSRKVRRRG